jgi:hypothetical protein
LIPFWLITRLIVGALDFLDQQFPNENTLLSPTSEIFFRIEFVIAKCTLRTRHLAGHAHEVDLALID